MSIEQKRAFKKKAGLWAQSQPLPRLTLLMQMMTVIRHLQHKFFHLASAKFEREQQVKCARDSHRTYRVLEVALGKDLQQAFEAIYACFAREPLGFPIHARNLKHRSLAFRLLARCGSALHQVMRFVHQRHPYRAFLLLKQAEGSLQDLASEPACMRDEFSADFFTRFNREQQEEALVTLEAIAAGVDVDISAMEARHALTRRTTVQKSLQTWVASLESVNVTWTVRQCQRQNQNKARAQPKPKTQQPTDHKEKTNKGMKRKLGESQAGPAKTKTSGGGGGPFRAFIHENYGTAP